MLVLSLVCCLLRAALMGVVETVEQEKQAEEAKNAQVQTKLKEAAQSKSLMQQVRRRREKETALTAVCVCVE
jgi:hypothetical protein